VDVQVFWTKALMTASVTLINHGKWLSVVLFASMFYIAYLLFRWQPHLQAAMNHARVGTTGSVLLIALLGLVMAYHPGLDMDNYEDRQQQA
jgi:hypothetical protein